MKILLAEPTCCRLFYSSSSLVKYYEALLLHIRVTLAFKISYYQGPQLSLVSAAKKAMNNYTRLKSKKAVQKDLYQR